MPLRRKADDVIPVRAGPWEVSAAQEEYQRSGVSYSVNQETIGRAQGAASAMGFGGALDKDAYAAHSERAIPKRVSGSNYVPGTQHDTYRRGHGDIANERNRAFTATDTAAKQIQQRARGSGRPY